MSLIPFAIDLPLSRRPIITFIIAAICIAVHSLQTTVGESTAARAAEYCASDLPRETRLAIQKSAHGDDADMCAELLLAIHTSRSPTKTINELAHAAAPYKSVSRAYAVQFTQEKLRVAYRSFAVHADRDVSQAFLYYPDTWNVWRMITSSFAHADWWHLIGNMFFLFAFGPTVEGVLGALLYIACVLGFAIISSVAYALTTTTAIPALGFSGVVSGLMGIFWYLIPQAKIRCLIWFGIPLGQIAVPAWILTVWYVGWDVWAVLKDVQSSTNFIAHVSGAFSGYLLGVLALQRYKQEIQENYRSVVGSAR